MTKHKKRVLIVAFHFPPCAVSSGIQRTLSFVRNLPSHGWQPIVLTVSDSAHEKTNPSQLKSIPPEAIVARTPALDTARHLSFKGRYWSRLAVPDRWRSWWITAVPMGLYLIWKYDISIVWSTYPISTSHTIGGILSRLTGIPWIADFRDPMVEYVQRTKEIYPKEPLLRLARLQTETKAAKNASYLVFCTPSAKNIVKERYKYIPDTRMAVITNGYDEHSFIEAEKLLVPSCLISNKRVLLHSGTIYPGTDRDPTALFEAIKTLADKKILSPENFELRLRNSNAESYLQELAHKCGIEVLISLMPALPYHAALNEMLHASGLLLLQGFTSNPAVPAKLYEYLRAKRPIIGLTDPAGESANTLRDIGIPTCDITDSTAVTDILQYWWDNEYNSTLKTNNLEIIFKFSREVLTGQLALLLNKSTELRNN